ncbi:MAG: LysR substrate-binding domain-containing protein [Steroidobacteraceae bacterium]
MPFTELDISFSQLRCFVAVVDAGSLAEAGRQLGMSTASVSKAIARLEQVSGMKLLHRSTHSISLTHDGEQLVESAREVVRAAGVFSRSAVAQTRQSAAGWVRVAAPVAFMRGVLVPLFANLSRENPAISLDLRASNELTDLAGEGIDLAIRSGSLAGVPGHVQTPWFKFPWVVCASAEYVKNHGRPAQPGELAAHRLIGFRNQRTGQVRPWWFRRPDGEGDVIQLAPDANSILDDGDAAWKLGMQGGGIVSAPIWLAADDLRAGRAIELLREWRAADVTMNLLRRERRLTPERVTTVIAYLRQHAPPLTDLI